MIQNEGPGLPRPEEISAAPGSRATRTARVAPRAAQRFAAFTTITPRHFGASFNPSNLKE